MSRRTYSRRRRGVVLLICLSILVLFMLIATTFVILSGQYLSGAKAMGRHDVVGDDPQKDTDMAFYQIISGPRPVMRSAVRGHDLLRDLYGIDYAKGIIKQASLEMQGQLVLIAFDDPNNDFAQRKGYYNGRVFTILNGPAAGISTRVVDYSYDATTTPKTGYLRVEMFESDAAQFVQNVDTNANLELGGFRYRFLINGAPFNGTGYGYVANASDADYGNLNQLYPHKTGLSVNLLPHFAAYLPDTDPTSPLYQIAVPDAWKPTPLGPPMPSGGADESWDAVDKDNMFLARNTPHLTEGIEPSFHRRALVRYWEKQLGSPNADQLRRFVLRPLWTDHPSFDGSNAAFNASGGVLQLLSALKDGPWDVDNDGDGVADSIWLDLDLPLKTTPDGRRYKPLVAFLIQDLDGRLNLNAHGTLAHGDASYFERPPAAWAGNLAQAPALPRGIGYGPADISLRQIFLPPIPNDPTTIQPSPEFRALFNGAIIGGATVNGRYGVPIVNASPPPQVLDGQAGLNGTDDTLSTIKSIGIPASYTAVVSAYASPPDVWGRSAVAVDYSGQPMFPYMNSFTGFGAPPGPSQTVDDPYELNLSANGSQDTGAWDAPYTVAELERLLRYNDVDAPLLPRRLLNLASTTFNSPANRRLVTTDSMHIPVANVTIPVLDRTDPNLSGGTNPHYTDLLAARLATGMSTGPNDPAVAQQLAIMFPPEMYRGQLFNVNRLLGNGVDDNTNDVVDEPAERTAAEQIWGGVSFNHTNNDPYITDRRFAPQIYARHLYCMMMFLADQGYTHPFGEGIAPGSTEAQELTARRIAQWAINVVDFRDPDAIMTPFEYDVNPFDGWLPMDGDLRTDEGGQRRVIWGCEYPDLLITETKSFHDRRVKDTRDDDGATPDYRKKTGSSPPMPGDDDLDQYHIPQGSLFLEFYSTRSRGTSNPQLPAELYDRFNGQLDLGRVAPVGPDGLRHPVWQVAITARHVNQNDSPYNRSTLGLLGYRPDSTSYQPERMTLYPPSTGPDFLDIERIVWFTPFNPDPATDARAQYTFFGRTGAMTPAAGPPGGNSQQWFSNVKLAPGGYVVVGPRALTAVGSTDDADGIETTFNPRSPHRLSLAGGTFTATDNNNPANNTMPAVGTQIRAPLGIIAAAHPPTGWANPNVTAPTGIGVNISEPLPQANYYMEPRFDQDGNVAGSRPMDAYFDPSKPPEPDRTKATYNANPDTPFDNTNPMLGGSDINLLKTGTSENFKTAFLQRLANPLEGYHPLLNPYITVDWLPIDLTVFNGSDKKPGNYPAPPFLPFDKEDPDPAAAPPEQFATRERGFRSRQASVPPYAPTGPRDPKLWPAVTTAPVQTATTGPAENYFQHSLNHTLGYINDTMCNLDPPPGPGESTITVAPYIGDPPEPFPWLNWLNRPLASPLELMQVSVSSQGRLLSEFSVDTGANPYDVTPPPPADYALFRAPFNHLLNFTYGARPTVVGPPQPGPNFYRLFDLVETPSPFVGTERWYNPTVFGAAGTPNKPIFPFDPTAVSTAADGLRPPYNRLSRFRDPGRPNINTIFDRAVFEGVMKGYQLHDPSVDSGAFWTKFVESRQGFTGPSLNGSYPTEYANAFRTSASADLAPNVTGLRRDGVEATLLRSDSGVPSQPLFGLKPTDPTVDDITPNRERAYNNSRKNSASRYHGVQRLGNLVSTHSNVYAIWITVGYFEVEAGVVNNEHPDGYYLGQEIGSDTGTIKRHRAFYIFDRSIPVAFEPGENHNVDRAVLLKRFIE